MKQLISAIVFFILIVIQTTWDGVLSIYGVVPNFMLTYTILYSFGQTPVKAGFLGAVCGLVFDMSSNGIIGFNALLVMYIAVIANHITNKFYCENIIVSAILVFALSLAYSIFKLTASVFLIDSLSFWYVLCRYVLLECLYSALLTFVMYWLTKWINNEYIRGI